jgi:hypothetical protein
VELCDSREVASYSVTQQDPDILWHPKCCYHDHERHPLVLTLSQMNPVHTTTNFLFKLYFNIIAQVLNGLPSGLFPSAIPTHTPYTHHVFLIRAACPALLNLMQLFIVK